MKRKADRRDGARDVMTTGAVRLLVSLVLLAGVLVFLTVVMPWHFPYDRLEHLYGIEGYETIEAGHPGGEFVLMCVPINEGGRIELMVDGKVYGEAERLDNSRYSVYLGPELFDAPRRLELTLRECYQFPIYLRSNTIHMYVMPAEES